MAQQHPFQFRPTPFPSPNLNQPPLLPPVVLQALHRLVTFSSDIQLLTSHFAPHFHFAGPHPVFSKPTHHNPARRRKPTARSTAWRLTSPSIPPHLAPLPSPLRSTQPPPISCQPTSKTNQVFSAPSSPTRSPHLRSPVTHKLQVEALDLATFTRPSLPHPKLVNRSDCTVDGSKNPLDSVPRSSFEPDGQAIEPQALDNLASPIASDQTGDSPERPLDSLSSPLPLESHPSSFPAVNNPTDQPMVAVSDDRSDPSISDRLMDLSVADGYGHVDHSDLVSIPSECPPLPVVTTLDIEADSLSSVTDSISSAPDVPSALSTVSNHTDSVILQPTTTVNLSQFTIDHNDIDLPTSQPPATISSAKKKKKKKAKKKSLLVSESTHAFSSEGGWISLDQDFIPQPNISEIDPIPPTNTYSVDTTSIDFNPQILESQQMHLCEQLLLLHPGYILLRKTEDGILLGKDRNQNLYDQDAFCYSLDGTFIFQRKNGVMSW